MILYLHLEVFLGTFHLQETPKHDSEVSGEIVSLFWEQLGIPKKKKSLGRKMFTYICYLHNLVFYRKKMDVQRMIQMLFKTNLKTLL